LSVSAWGQKITFTAHANRYERSRDHRQSTTRSRFRDHSIGTGLFVAGVSQAHAQTYLNNIHLHILV